MLRDVRLEVQVSRMKSSLATKLAIFLVCGGLAALVVMSVVRVLNKDTSEIERFARQNGWDPDEFVRLNQITEKAANARELSSEEWDLLKKIITTSKDPDLKVRSASVLGSLKGTTHEKEAIDLAGNLLKEKDDYVITIGLISLYRLDQSGSREAAKGLLKHKSAHVRKRAAQLLDGKLDGNANKSWNDLGNIAKTVLATAVVIV